jgi:hypothetical protein
MVGVAASSALFFPVVRAQSSTRVILGMSVATYSYVSIWLAIAVAAILAVVGIAIPQN